MRSQEPPRMADRRKRTHIPAPLANGRPIISEAGTAYQTLREPARPKTAEARASTRQQRSLANNVEQAPLSHEDSPCRA